MIYILKEKLKNDHLQDKIYVLAFRMWKVNLIIKWYILTWMIPSKIWEPFSPGMDIGSPPCGTAP